MSRRDEWETIKTAFHNNSLSRRQRILEFKSRLQRENAGCPWPASAIAVVRAVVYESERTEAILRAAKKSFGITDDDIMLLMSAWERRAWNEALDLIEAKFKKK